MSNYLLQHFIHPISGLLASNIFHISKNLHHFRILIIKSEISYYIRHPLCYFISSHQVKCTNFIRFYFEKKNIQTILILNTVLFVSFFLISSKCYLLGSWSHLLLSLKPQFDSLLYQLKPQHYKLMLHCAVNIYIR